MTDAPKLLPCPFCGEADQDTLHIQHMERTIIHPTYRVACDNCGGSSGWTDRGDHVEEWNRRANPEALPAVQTFTAADLEAAFRLALEMAGEYMAQKSLDWRFSSPWHGKDFQRELTKLTPPADLVARLRQKGVRDD